MNSTELLCIIHNVKTHDDGKCLTKSLCHEQKLLNFTLRWRSFEFCLLTAEYKTLCPGGEGFRPNPITVILEGKDGLGRRQQDEVWSVCGNDSLSLSHIRHRRMPGAARPVPGGKLCQHLRQLPVRMSRRILPQRGDAHLRRSLECQSFELLKLRSYFFWSI